MAEALYRKYRPQTFDDVVGQTHIERTLKNAIEQDKVSHAYLFCGPRGTGKTTTARLLAKAMLCEHGPTPSPDGTCEQCQAIAEGTHPDVNEMDAASRTGVENVREEIIGRVQYAPIRGRYKIYIIDEVHMLSPAAFNALLKTLEEPPSHVIFIMCTTDPQQVPETICSRCQRFDFHRLSNEEIVARLGAVCGFEGVEFEAEALELVAHRAQGGMRDALTTLEQLIAFGNGRVSMEVARSALGSIDVDDMSTIVQAIANRDAAGCFLWMSQYVETGADLAQFARDLASYVRDLYVLTLTDGEVAVGAFQTPLFQMNQEAQLFGVDRLAYILRVLGDLSSEMRTSTNPRLSFEIALTRMVRPQSDLTIDALAARVEALEAALAAGGGATPAEGAPARSGAVARQSIPPTDVGLKPAAPLPAATGVGLDAASARDKAAQLRAQMEQRRAERAAASAGAPSAPSAPPAPSAPAAPPAPSPTPAASVSQAFSLQTNGAAPAAPTAADAAPTPSPHDASRTMPAAPAPSDAAQLLQSPTRPSAPPAAVSAGLAGKLTNPAALQRGWQASLAHLRRQRAAYGALMLSARVMPASDGRSILIAFPEDNDFVFSAALKPEVGQLLGESLVHGFGEAVPFQFVKSGGSAGAPSAPAGKAQSSGTHNAQASAAFAANRASAPASNAVPPRPQAPQAPRPAQTAAPSGGAPNRQAAQPAPSRFQQPAAPAQAQPARPAQPDMTPPWEDDVVPYDDADAMAYAVAAEPYDDYDAYDSPGVHKTSPQAPLRPAAAGVASASAASEKVKSAGQSLEALRSASLQAPAPRRNEPAQPAVDQQAPAPAPNGAQPAPEDAAPAVQLDVEGPAPVDPYPEGQRLGFSSMPNPNRRVKGMVAAVGWPGVQAPEKRKKAPTREEPAAQGAQDQDAQENEAPDEEPFFDPDAYQPPQADNPFAHRAMPVAPADEPSDEEQQAPQELMSAFDIFDSFGVSFEDVREE